MTGCATALVHDPLTGENDALEPVSRSSHDLDAKRNADEHRHAETLRQKLMQSAVLNKIDREGLSIDTEPVRRSLDTIRRHVGHSPLMDHYLGRWDEILRTA